MEIPPSLSFLASARPVIVSIGIFLNPHMPMQVGSFRSLVPNTTIELGHSPESVHVHLRVDSPTHTTPSSPHRTKNCPILEKCNIMPHLQLSKNEPDPGPRRVLASQLQHPASYPQSHNIPRGANLSNPCPSSANEAGPASEAISPISTYDMHINRRPHGNSPSPR